MRIKKKKVVDEKGAWLKTKGLRDQTGSVVGQMKREGCRRRNSSSPCVFLSYSVPGGL